ncbi:poly(A) RNA polymerase, mitochondrial-like isoform X2 [Danaus plexippus]|nr:poly(A) RNA polymerase, mitochondrial-like isoform X2 [Danaus plexippus]
MLIEFSSEENLQSILQSCCSHQKDLEVMAVQSPFVWFRAASVAKQKLTANGLELRVKDGNNKHSEDLLFEDLMKCQTVSEQIQMLYDKTILNDVGARLRFMVARQLEVILSSLYTNIQVLPFGSSVNGFGKMGCDLDLVLTNSLTDGMMSPSNRLVYQEKRSEGSRGPWQRHMELVGALLELRVPGATRVQRILNARVPIVKYSQELVDVDVDLCFKNMSGVYMSALLYSLGALDPAGPALAVSVRRWAAAVQLTQPHPGRWITNFPLTLMVLFFLMTQKILPTFRCLLECAGKEDVRLTEDNINCTFVRDLSRLPPHSYRPSSDDLQTLLLKFFEFYSQFDFQEHAISVIEGKPIRKPNTLPLYIVNPLEPALNVSRNVSYEECERLKMEVRNAAWHLEACLDNNRGDDWGILGLVEKKTTRGLKKLLRAGNQHRLVSVKDLFKDDEQPASATSPRKTHTDTDREGQSSGRHHRHGADDKHDKVKLKNTQTAKEVYRIRRDKLI